MTISCVRVLRSLCLGLILCGGLSALGEGVKAGARFPDIRHFRLAGDVPALAGKVVLVDFWASWCGPCKQSFPALDSIYQEYADQGLVILGVSVDEDGDAMEKFLAEHDVTFPVVRDVDQKLVSTCAVEAMPTSMLIDCQGVVRYVHRGFHGASTEEELRAHIESLLPCVKGGAR